MPTIIEKDAGSYECPFNNFRPCAGAKCMAFAWDGPTHDRCETDNLVDTVEGQRPIGAPPMPDGDGWIMDGPAFSKGYHRSEKDKLPKATCQRWVRKREQVGGYCSRTESRDHYTGPW